jgi:hypothetical protein
MEIFLDDVSTCGEMLENADCLQEEFAWLEAVIGYRLDRFLAASTDEPDPGMPLPAEELFDSPYADFVIEHQLGLADRLLLLLALAPHVQPEVLEPFFIQSGALGRPYTSFGGVSGGSFRGFQPTGHTAVFLLTDLGFDQAFAVQHLLAPNHVFARERVLHLGDAAHGEPPLSGKLLISATYLTRFTTVATCLPQPEMQLPARLVTTAMQWNDLVLPPATMEELQGVLDWLEFGEQLLSDDGMGKRLAPGHKCLFYGPPGTGKTLTASLLGQSVGRDVYKIDLSMMVSKFIGETEKNLARVFEMAEHKNWILFFDEADSLFGRRTELNSSNDRHANQEVSYLLQRMEAFPGLVILASNLKDQIDAAFLRRFHAMIPFPVPGPAERERLWATAFASALPPAETVNFAHLATRFPFSGGHIMNAVRHASLRTLRRKLPAVPMDELEAAGRREMNKTGVELW